MTGELWLLGEHIAHSPSPAMHNAGLGALGLPPRYQLRPCDAPSLHAVLDEAEARCRGVNVTLPHKTRVAERYAGVLDETARRVGAVNTVLFNDGVAERALNTDVAGLLVAWRRAALQVEGRRVVLFGAGGAARAAIVALAEARAGGVSVRARRHEAADAVRALAAREGLPADAGDGPGGELLLVATPVVDDPEALVREALRTPGAVHDLRYGPCTVPLRNAAVSAGHLFSDGTSMLLGQGIAALGAFLGQSLPAEAQAAMALAVAAHLKRSPRP